MKENYYDHFIDTVKNIESPLVREFIDRINQRELSRDENLTSHLCCFFAAIDTQHKLVFLGLHKKSGLWLFNGGHIDKDEWPNQTIAREMVEEWGYSPIDSQKLEPELLTIVEIEDKTKNCKRHFDIWFFISANSDTFNPDPALLETEFSDIRWMDIKEAEKLCSDQYSMIALEYIKKKYFQSG